MVRIKEVMQLLKGALQSTSYLYFRRVPPVKRCPISHETLFEPVNFQLSTQQLAKPYGAIWPEMLSSPTAVAEFHIKTTIERRQGYQIHEKRKSYSLGIQSPPENGNLT